MNKKRFKTLDEQIAIMQSKGLIIDDKVAVKDILLRENYFFVSGYRHLFYKSHTDKKFYEGTNFNELYAVFCFDRSLRNIFFKNLQIVENNLKSIISYQLSKKYGINEKDYLNPKNFTTVKSKKAKLDDILVKMKRQIRINGSKHTATQHYLNNYGFVPMWILVKVLSFGILAEFYTVLKKEDQEEVSSIYNMDVDTFSNYLPILANYRNLCAHEDLLFVNRTQKVIDDTIYHEKLYIPKMDGEYIYGKNDLFALVIILKHLLTPKEFKMFISEIEFETNVLENKLKAIPLVKVLDKMGFPMNWCDIIKDKEE